MGSRARLSGHHVDGDGEPISGAEVFIYQQHTTDLITDAPVSATIYTHDSDHPTLSAGTTTLPLITANDGSWGLFTEDAMRVDIKMTKAGHEDYWLYGQDLLRVGNNPALDDVADVDTTGKADGDVLTYDDGTDEWVPQSVVMGDLLDYQFVRKTADDVITADATLSDDDELFVALGANQVWLIEIGLLYRAATTADFAVSLNNIVGATSRLGLIGGASGVSSSSGDGQWAGDSAGTFGGAGVGQTMLAQLKGIYRTAGSSGTLKLQWAQGVSDASNTTLRADSYMLARRVV